MDNTIFTKPLLSDLWHDHVILIAVVFYDYLVAVLQYLAGPTVQLGNPTREQRWSIFAISLSCQYLHRGLRRRRQQRRLLDLEYQQFVSDHNCHECAVMPSAFANVRDELLNPFDRRCHRGGNALGPTTAREVLAGPSTWSHDDTSEKMIFTFDPDNINTVLRAASDEWSTWPQPSVPGHIFQAESNDRWLKMRDALVDGLALSELDDDMIAQHLNILDHATNPYNLEGETDIFDLFELFQRFSMDVLGEILLQVSFGMQDYGIFLRARAEVIEHWNLWPKPMLSALGWCSWAFESSFGEYLSGIKRWSLVSWLTIPFRSYATRILTSIVSTRVAEVTTDAPHTEDALISSLLRAGFDNQTITRIMRELLIAGLESTAAPLAWLFAELAANPQARYRLRQDLSTIFEQDQAEESDVTWSDLKHCAYLQACILETLRRYPVMSSISRVANRNIVLPKGGGADGTAPIAVGKGTTVICNIQLMHHRGEDWTDWLWADEDAWQWQPERWRSRAPGNNFLPFGVGTRSCPGQDLAMRQMSLAAYVLLRDWQDMRVPEGQDNLAQHRSKIVTPLNGVKLSVTHAFGF